MQKSTPGRNPKKVSFDPRKTYIPTNIYYREQEIQYFINKLKKCRRFAAKSLCLTDLPIEVLVLILDPIVTDLDSYIQYTCKKFYNLWECLRYRKIPHEIDYYCLKDTAAITANLSNMHLVGPLRGFDFKRLCNYQFLKHLTLEVKSWDFLLIFNKTPENLSMFRVFIFKNRSILNPDNIRRISSILVPNKNKIKNFAIFTSEPLTYTDKFDWKCKIFKAESYQDRMESIYNMLQPVVARLRSLVEFIETRNFDLRLLLQPRQEKLLHFKRLKLIMYDTCGEKLYEWQPKVVLRTPVLFALLNLWHGKYYFGPFSPPGEELGYGPMWLDYENDPFFRFLIKSFAGVIEQ